MKYIIAIGIFQALLAVVLLLRSRYRTNADDLLISLVVCIGLHLSIKFYIFSFIKDQEVLNMLNTFIGFSYIPLLYLYMRKTINPEFVPSSRWYLFFPLMLGAIAYFSTICVLAAGSPKGHQFLYWYNTITLYTLLSSDIIFSCTIIYIAVKKLSSSCVERKLIVQLASLFLLIGLIGSFMTIFMPNAFSLSYLGRSVIYALLICIVIRIITHKYTVTIEPLLENSKDENVFNEIDFSATTELISHADLQIDTISLFTTQPVSNTIVISKKERPAPQKRKEILREKEMFKILLKLEAAMEAEKHFTDSELTIDKLSKLTNQKKYHVSETLNHFVNKPFYTFINEYRIQYVKDRLAQLTMQNKSVNILELAYEAGFNSKSSFNRYFKEVTSNTPTEYLNLISKETVN
ncbi:AraC-like DNA-binding protein [Flavobacterium sp. 270]|uniref:helix-turn-helix domain-containing protein n=1 Tax=Flavobacterium sp. 270 TaxID=2512114 RepID=UPI001066A127|nr:helix-turn-helix domain-containing protein [Flavobacterium sp. 270]TDW49180.1 AraC-like DNA-binding protein [Flavobacterium sp. 270]